MTKLEALLRISIVQAELVQLAGALDPHTRATLLYATRVLRLLKPDMLSVIDPDVKSANVSRLGL